MFRGQELADVCFISVALDKLTAFHHQACIQIKMIQKRLNMDEATGARRLVGY